LVAALAAEILVQQGSRRHRDQQSQRLQHPLAEVRAAAIRSFSWKALGVKTWRQALYAPHEVLRRAALTRRAADDVPPWAIPLVAETARRDPVHAVRRQALRALGQIAPAAVVPVARQSLQSPDRPIRLAALTVLAPLGDNETVRALWRQCLGHGEPVEQIRAATLLARQGETDGLASLRQWLKVPQVAWARAALLGAGQVGTPLHPEIRQALARPEPAVRLQAAVALIDADDDEGGQQAREVLVELLDRPGWLGLQAARALGEQGAETEGPLRAAVVRALESDEPALQVAAVGLLAPWSPRAKIPLLAPLLRGAAPLVRVAAAGALVAAPSR
jgi:hypothetical protein